MYKKTIKNIVVHTCFLLCSKTSRCSWRLANKINQDETDSVSWLDTEAANHDTSRLERKLERFWERSVQLHSVKEGKDKSDLWRAAVITLISLALLSNLISETWLTFMLLLWCTSFLHLFGRFHEKWKNRSQAQDVHKLMTVVGALWSDHTMV